MPSKSDWSIVKLATLANETKGSMVGGPFGSDLVSRDYIDSGVPVIRGTNLPLNSKFSEDGFVFVSERKADSLHLNCAQPGDLVFTQRGTLGQVGIIPKKSQYKRFLISQSQMKLSVNLKKAEPLFIYYYFRLPSIVSYVENHALQSGVPHINLGILRKFDIMMPPLPIQRKIAAVLSTYEDLIENNNRRIAILEKMAEELYREWFVRLRFPGHEKVKVVKGVPEGWEVKQLRDIIELAYGKALKEEDRLEGIVPVYGSSGIVGYHNAPLVKGPGIIVGRKGNVGSVVWSYQDFFPIDTAYFVRSKLPLEYLFYQIQSMNFINNDAAVPGLNREQAYSNKFFFPKLSLIEAFAKIVKPLFLKKEKHIQQNFLLITSRDRLLSRLMSGKIDVEKMDIRFPESMLEDAANA